MINLLPNDVREERMYGRRNRMLVGYISTMLVAAALVAIVMLGSLRFVASDESSIRATIEADSVQIAQLESQISDLSTTVSRFKTVNEVFEQSLSFSDLIPEIGSLLPQGSILNGLSLTGGTTDPLSLDISLLNAELVPVLQSNLVQSELFEAADVASISSTDSDEGYSSTVSISLSFTGTAEAKAQAARQAQAAAEALQDAQQGGN